MSKTSDIIKKLSLSKKISDEDLLFLMKGDADLDCLFGEADRVRRKVYGNGVYIRGLIEISNFCKNNCLYCGIRCGNEKASRYRLTKEDVLFCCKRGYELGFRTFVLQGGEDEYYTDDVLTSIISEIKKLCPDSAVTLSLGERSFESYKMLFDAGADRYLLRHETADDVHYGKLHPRSMNLETRKKCLFNLKEIGYQVGSGFMVGSPFQTDETLLKDLRFLQELSPDMIGIGPFLTHKDTPFKEYPNGDLELTLRLVAIARLMFPHALIPATTALGTLSQDGRARALSAGANVVMPNLSPNSVRSLYSLYDNKAYSGTEAAESLSLIKNLIEKAGYEVVTTRGDVKR